jgi:branched-chain amino acid transport system ATP-binding protein
MSETVMADKVTADTLLDVDGIETCYGLSQVLFGLSLSIKPGEMVSLMGRNGMGKTTTIRSIMGLTPARAGAIRFAGAEVRQLPSYRIAKLGVGLVPEGRQIFPNLTVRENLVAAAADRFGSGNPWTLAAIYVMFPRLAERASNMGNQLSGGEQQMLAIGRGIASSPRLLMLDEPSMGLAPVVADLIFERVGELHRDGLTILLVEQRVAEAVQSCDFGYVLETGRVVLEGTHDALLADDRIRSVYLGM